MVILWEKQKTNSTLSFVRICLLVRKWVELSDPCCVVFHTTSSLARSLPSDWMIPTYRTVVNHEQTCHDAQRYKWHRMNSFPVGDRLEELGTRYAIPRGFLLIHFQVCRWRRFRRKLWWSDHASHPSLINTTTSVRNRWGKCIDRTKQGCEEKRGNRR